MFSLSRIFERACLSYPQRPAILDGNVRITYSALRGRVRNLVSALQGLGVDPGDRVAVVAKNSTGFLELQFACALGGFIFVPLNFRLAQKEIEHVLRDSGAKVIFADPGYIDLARASARASAEPNQVFVLSDAPAEGIPAVASRSAIGAGSHGRYDARPDDIAAIYYTSGSSGKPKGVCISHLNAYCGALDGVLALNLQKNDVWMHSAPLFHMASAMFVWALPLVGGSQVACHFRPADTLKLMAAERVTATAAPMTLVSMLAEQVALNGITLPALRHLIYGGAPSPLSVVERNYRVFGEVLCHVYAMTECTGFVTFLGPEGHAFNSAAERERSRSAGLPVNFVDLAVVDEEGRGVPPGTVGELVMSGPKVTSGYWKAPEQTQAALRDGRLYSGDLGYLDEEGFLYVVDRKADLIKTGGESVYAVEVESVLAAQAFVREVGVIGLPDEKWGEAVTAIVVPEAGARIDIDTLFAACRESLAGYKVPKTIRVRNEPLPKSAAGKIAKTELKKLYRVN